MSLPSWVLYPEHRTPREGELFVVESVTHDWKEGDNGELVTLVTLRPLQLTARLTPTTKLIERSEE